MKRLLSISLILIMSLSAFFLTGCAAIFDGLNFNRYPMPTVDSTVDNDLTNPHTNQPDPSITRDTFLTFASEVAGREHYSDSMTINMTNSYGGYMGHFYAGLDVGERQEDDSRAYANFSININEQTERFYIYQDGFSTSDDSNKYAFDEYFDKLNLPVMDMIEQGGYAPVIFTKLADAFDSAILTYINAKPAREITLKKDKALEIVASYMTVPDSFGNILSVSPMTLIKSDEQTNLAFVMTFAGGMAEVMFSSNNDEPYVSGYNSSQPLPSYMYVYNQLLNKYERWQMSDTQFTASVNYSGLFNSEYLSLPTSGVATVAYTKVPPVKEEYKVYYGPEYIMSYSLGDIQLYEERNYWSTYIIKDGKVVTTYEDGYNPDYDAMNGTLYRGIIQDTAYSSYYGDEYVAITSELNGDEVTITITRVRTEYIGDFYDDEKGWNDYYGDYTSVLTVKMDKDFNRLHSISLRSGFDEQAKKINDKLVDINYDMTFDYSTITPVPKPIIDFWTEDMKKPW